MKGELCVRALPLEVAYSRSCCPWELGADGSLHVRGFLWLTAKKVGVWEHLVAWELKIPVLLSVAPLPLFSLPSLSKICLNFWLSLSYLMPFPTSPLHNPSCPTFFLLSSWPWCRCSCSLLTSQDLFSTYPEIVRPHPSRCPAPAEESPGWASVLVFVLSGATMSFPALCKALFSLESVIVSPE